MALQQNIQHGTGAYSSYWRVTLTNLDYANQIATILMLGYVDEQARQSGKTNLDMRNFFIDPSLFPQYFSITELDENTNPVKQAYIYIKTTDEFKGAIDV